MTVLDEATTTPSVLADAKTKMAITTFPLDDSILETVVRLRHTVPDADDEGDGVDDFDLSDLHLVSSGKFLPVLKHIVRIGKCCPNGNNVIRIGIMLSDSDNIILFGGG